MFPVRSYSFKSEIEIKKYKLIKCDEKWSPLKNEGNEWITNEYKFSILSEGTRF